jgi:hypothetical protein
MLDWRCVAGTRRPALRQPQPRLRTRAPRINTPPTQPPSQAPLPSAPVPILSSRPARPLLPAVTTSFECPDAAKSCTSACSWLCCLFSSGMCFLCESISLSPVPWPLWPFFWRRSQREPSSDGSRQYHAFCSVDFLLLFGRVPSVLVPALSLPPAKSGHVACSPPFSLPTLRR